MFRVVSSSSFATPLAAQAARFTAGASVRALSQDTSFLSELGLESKNSGVFDGTSWEANGEWVDSVSPYTGQVIASVQTASLEDYERVAEASVEAYKTWREVPAPKRGEIVRQIGNAFRKYHEPLGKLIALEFGKIKVEGLGEVQETIDICDFATGLSRQIGGLAVPSERENHTLIERWNPIGPHALISAVNFPNAVTMWGTAIAMVCGNSVMHKGSPGANLVSVAQTKIVTDVLAANDMPTSLYTVVCGDVDIGEAMANDPRFPLMAFTGSTAVGLEVEKTVRSRWGETLLELGGNNAHIVEPDADLELAVRATLFGAVGTAGQRCTSTRRLLLHEDIADEFLERLVTAYQSVPAGDPLSEDVLLGPVNSTAQVELYKSTIEEAKAGGAEILVGGELLSDVGPQFVAPTVTRGLASDHYLVMEERFIPVLHALTYSDLDEAIAINNSVEQGLSSSLFTRNPNSIFKWMGPSGSDCGIVNVNAGSSGAEISLAFGGNKATGGGRESGSDAWKQYMRRSSCTINHGDDLPLAQGINF